MLGTRGKKNNKKHLFIQGAHNPVGDTNLENVQCRWMRLKTEICIQWLLTAK